MLVSLVMKRLIPWHVQLVRLWPPPFLSLLGTFSQPSLLSLAVVGNILGPLWWPINLTKLNPQLVLGLTHTTLIDVGKLHLHVCELVTVPVLHMASSFQNPLHQFAPTRCSSRLTVSHILLDSPAVAALRTFFFPFLSQLHRPCTLGDIVGESPHFSISTLMQFLTRLHILSHIWQHVWLKSYDNFLLPSPHTDIAPYGSSYLVLILLIFIHSKVEVKINNKNKRLVADIFIFTCGIIIIYLLLEY